MTYRMLIGGLLCAAAFPSLAQEAIFTTGPATQTNPGLIDCGSKARTSAVGEIASDDGTVRTVLAATHFESAAEAADLFNACDGDELSSASELDLASVSVLDAGGGEGFTAWIFADNYFELYVNGELLAVDPVPFTPFNSNRRRVSTRTSRSAWTTRRPTRTSRTSSTRRTPTRSSSDRRTSCSTTRCSCARRWSRKRLAKPITRLPTASLSLSVLGDRVACSDARADDEIVVSAGALDPAAFVAGALTEDLTTVDCTLSGGTETTCHRPIPAMI